LTNLASYIGDEPELENETSGKEGKDDNIFGDNKKPSKLDEQRLNIINWVKEVLWSDEKIKKSGIINSFNAIKLKNAKIPKLK
jgi:hypothetical protein